MFFSFNNCIRLRYIQLSLGDRAATLFGKICRLCLPYVHFVAVELYLSVLSFRVGGFIALRKRAYSNILKISPPKTDFFHISTQNMDCGTR